MAIEESPFYVIEDLAVILKKSVNGVRKMRALDHLPDAAPIGNRLYWDRVEFDAWVKERKEAAADGLTNRDQVAKWLRAEYPTGFRKMVEAREFPPSIFLNNKAHWAKSSVIKWMNSKGYR